MRFPHDDYTPHGYLAIPGHTRNLTPRGVVRSHGAGFRWHYPAYGGTYGGRRETYRAGFRVAIDRALELADFDAASSPYHSKNIVALDLRRGGVHGRIEWLLVGEHAQRATLETTGSARVSLHVEYSRVLAAAGEWGESGLVGRREGDCLVLQGFEDGDAFVLWTSRPPDDLGIATDPDDARRWAAQPAPGLPDEGFVATLGARGETVALHAVLGFAASEDNRLEAILARGKTVPEARRHLEEARRTAGAERARKVAEDDAFWAGAPRLAGDWPAHWRRGLVYDLETLRAMVKPPTGIYRHPWDAMQIQAPRVVLGESAVDALLLAYADPRVGQDLLAGTFADAPEPNVPCSREDGSYNMVAADGSACGTSPQWGYPWLVLEGLYGLRPDRDWLARLYPRLAGYLDWWLAHRRDADGWLVHACSWESGQDESPRFGEQPLGGGHPTRHLRAVDLQAAFAHAAQTMARFAETLGHAHDMGKWRTLADEFADRTDRLWDGTRYADHDSQADRFTATNDVMLLAPVALGVARPERVAASRPAIASLDAETLTWPVPTWTAVEAAMVAGMPSKASALAWAVCERAYGFWDAREAAVGRTLPGVSCEYWPPSGRCGGEGYGWGAFTTHLVIHTLVGFSCTPEGLVLRPNLPPDWRRPGTGYGLEVRCRGRPLTVALEPLNAERVSVCVNGTRTETRWGEATHSPWSAL